MQDDEYSLIQNRMYDDPGTVCINISIVHHNVKPGGTLLRAPPKSKTKNQTCLVSQLAPTPPIPMAPDRQRMHDATKAAASGGAQDNDTKHIQDVLSQLLHSDAL
jgi:hypothetical protein